MRLRRLPIWRFGLEAGRAKNRNCATEVGQFIEPFGEFTDDAEHPPGFATFQIFNHALPQSLPIGL